MILSRPFRALAFTGLLAAMLPAGLLAHAQRHGGGPGGGPGGGGFGGSSPMSLGGGMGGRREGDRGFGSNLIAPIRIEPQLGPPSRWWDDKKIIKRLSLRSDQQRRMDDIFESNKQMLVTLYTNLQREEARLVSLPAGDLQDESKVFAAIDRVAQARAELEKQRARTLMQIRQQMDTAQVSQLDREMASLR